MLAPYEPVLAIPLTAGTSTPKISLAKVTKHARTDVLTFSYVPAGDRLGVVYALAPYGPVSAIPLTAGTPTRK